MPSLVLDNCVQVRLIWQYKGADTAVNVMTAIKDDALGTIDQGRADGVATNITNALTALSVADKSAFSNSWKLARVGIRDVDTPNNVEFLGQAAVPWTGTNGSEILPLNVCSCVTLRTDKAGRSYRGRFYVSGWTEASSGTDGVMNAAGQTAAQNLVRQVQAGLDASGFTLAVGSRKLGQGRAVTSIVCRDTRWDTQRRRIVPGI